MFYFVSFKGHFVLRQGSNKNIRSVIMGFTKQMLYKQFTTIEKEIEKNTRMTDMLTHVRNTYTA